MKKSDLSPLQQLQLEKREIKRKLAVSEQRLSDNWEYLSNNIGSLALHSLLRGVKETFLGKSVSSSKEVFAFGQKENSIIKNLSATFPMLWEIAQPLLFSYAVRKVKSMFTSKKK